MTEYKSYYTQSYQRAQQPSRGRTRPATVTPARRSPQSQDTCSLERSIIVCAAWAQLWTTANRTAPRARTLVTPRPRLPRADRTRRCPADKADWPNAALSICITDSKSLSTAPRVAHAVHPYVGCVAGFSALVAALYPHSSTCGGRVQAIRDRDTGKEAAPKVGLGFVRRRRDLVTRPRFRAILGHFERASGGPLTNPFWGAVGTVDSFVRSFWPAATVVYHIRLIWFRVSRKARNPARSVVDPMCCPGILCRPGPRQTG